MMKSSLLSLLTGLLFLLAACVDCTPGKDEYGYTEPGSGHPFWFLSVLCFAGAFALDESERHT